MSQTPASPCARKASPIATANRGSASRSALLARLLLDLVVAMREFEARGFASARDAWRALHAYQGRRVRVLPPREPAFEAEVFDVAPDGALLVRLDDGRTLPLSSAEISLRGKSP